MVKNKKATINPISKKDNKCFRYAVQVAQSHEYVVRPSERIIKIKHFIIQDNCKGISFPSENNNWKKFEEKKITIALNVLV